MYAGPLDRLYVSVHDKVDTMDHKSDEESGCHNWCRITPTRRLAILMMNECHHTVEGKKERIY